MDSPDLAKLELMLQLGVEPLRGFVRRAEDREWRAFNGWLGLARELELTRDKGGANTATSAGSIPSPERRAAHPGT